MADDKQTALNSALAQIERQFGKGSIMKMGEFTDKMAFDVISTGSIALDLALGVGGLPRGRIVEIYGPESSGKTTLALHVIAEAQKAGGTAAFVDVEHALDPTYAQGLGIDLDNLLVSQPDAGEQAIEIAEMLVRSNAVDVVVVDSVAALVTKAELEGDMGDTHVGLQARLMSQALRKLTSAISSACSPASGWETRRLSRSIPRPCAYAGSSACSTSTKAAVPPAFWASAMTWRASVVLPLDSGP